MIRTIVSWRLACMLLAGLSVMFFSPQFSAAAYYPAPVLDSVTTSGSDFILKWSQPESVNGAPAGGYDIIIDGVDTNASHRTYNTSTTISGLSVGEHSFEIQARYSQSSQFPNGGSAPSSNEVSASSAPTGSAPTEYTTPVIDSVTSSNGDFVLHWSLPQSAYGTPDGGYDIVVDGNDPGTYRTNQTSTTITGLDTSVEHCFQIEARWTQGNSFPRSTEVCATAAPTNPSTAPAEYTIPVLDSVTNNNGDFVLNWSLPQSAYGTPDGGYDIVVDGNDPGTYRTNQTSTTISGLPSGDHCFVVEARWTQGNSFPRSNEVCASSAPINTAPAEYTTPVLDSVNTSNDDFVLSWTLPQSAYGTPDGGYDIIVDGVDTNATYRTSSTSTTIGNLPAGEHCFMVQARWSQSSEFPSSATSPNSNEVCATVAPTTTAPAEYTTPVLDSVTNNNGDFVLNWSLPQSAYGTPDGGYDIVVDGNDPGTYRTNQTSTTISGLASGDHCFVVEARWTQGNAFPRSNEVCAAGEPTDPSTSPTPTSPTMPNGKLAVFPGAQGFGADTPAGRGGQIIKVTNLNDSGSGSLRAAVQASGARIVVFEVGGTINLSSHLDIKNPYITVAGQTAPWPGITLKQGGITVQTHDVLIQHLKLRTGDSSAGPYPDERDSIQIHGSSYNVVVDHVSASWAVDENGSTWGNVHDVTFSNSIFSEGLKNSIHPEGSHSMGVLIGDHTKNIAIIGNLMAHNRERNPLFKGDTSGVVVNNLMYNGGTSTRLGMVDDYSKKPIYVSAVGNIFKDGPNTPSSNQPVRVYSSTVSGSQIFLSDNVSSGTLFRYDTSFDPRVSSPPVWHDSIQTRASSTVENWVLANAGARPADRDEVDQRIINDVKSGSGGIIDSPSDVGGYPNSPETFQTFTAPANPNGDDDGDGYTNIEELLHQMAAQVEGK